MSTNNFAWGRLFQAYVSRILILIFIQSFFACPSEAQNLITNGKFNGNLNGWTQGGSTDFTYASTLCNSPKGTDTCVWAGPGGSTGSLTQNFGQTDATKYTLSFSLKNGGGPINFFQASVNGQTMLSYSNLEFSNGGFSWANYSYTIAGAPGANNNSLRFEYRHDTSFWLLTDVEIVALSN